MATAAGYYLGKAIIAKKGTDLIYACYCSAVANITSCRAEVTPVLDTAFGKGMCISTPALFCGGGGGMEYLLSNANWDLASKSIWAVVALGGLIVAGKQLCNSCCGRSGYQQV